MLDYYEKNKKSAIVVSFDFKKAFDSIEWESIYQSMKFLGFTEQFIHWVKILYVRPLSCIKNNGYWGDFFELQKLTRQGDPASSLIFLFIIEILGLKIRQNVKIDGFEMFDFKMTTIQCADDLCVIVKPQAQSLDALFEEMERFARFSGLHINLQKTVAFKVSPCRDTDPQFYTQKSLVWTNEPVKLPFNIY